MRTVLLAMVVAVPLIAHSASDAAAPLLDLNSIALSPELGLAVYTEREQGHCVLCHAVSSLAVPFQGDVGPTMDGIGSRLTPAQIRYRIVDASRLNADSVMPPYYRTEGLNQVGADYVGKTALSAEQIEQLVHYLSQLKD